MNWLKSSNKSWVLLSLCIFSFAHTEAQNSLADYKKNYPDYNELVLDNSQSYRITIEDKKLKVIQNNHFESMILSENGIQNNVESFFYSDLIKIKSYDAYTISNSGGKEKKIPVTQTNEKLSSDKGIFYSDVKQRKLIFPNLEAGAKKVYNYQTEIVDPYLLNKFIFAGEIPVKNATFEVKASKDITIGYKIFNDPANRIEFSKTEKGGNYIYTWSLKDIDAVKYEPNAPGYLYTIPNINIYIKDYTVDRQKIEVLDDVSKLFNYYRGYTDQLNKTEDAALKAITTEITMGKTNDIDKIKSIFYWVKDNIKYIAFENGYEGFIPREASLVFERKFGDCKDMASIISAMAQYAQIKNVTIAWIGSRNIPYTYSELATPGVDDHMIAVFETNNDYLFLDATDKETRFGIPTAFIQGKEALFNDHGNYKIVTVPTVAAQENEIKETIKLQIVQDKLTGSGKTEYQGFNRSYLLAQIGDAANKTRFELIKSSVIKGNNKFNLKSFEEENKADRDLPYVINFNFDLENYILKVDKEIYINLYLDKHYENMNIEKDRISKFNFDFLSQINNKYELEIPTNYSVKHLPKDLHLDNALLKADFTFEVKNNTITLHVIIAQKKMILDNTDFELWNTSIKKFKDSYLETITLTEKK